MLPGIVFYGMSALLGAILNTRHVFGLPTWAPVLNNVVVTVVLVVFWLAPGDISLNPVHMGDTEAAGARRRHRAGRGRAGRRC